MWLYNYLYIFPYEWGWPRFFLLNPPPPCCHAGMMSHPPIPINELAEHIEMLKANDNLRLSQEYEVKMHYSSIWVNIWHYCLEVWYCLIKPSLYKFLFEIHISVCGIYVHHFFSSALCFCNLSIIQHSFSIILNGRTKYAPTHCPFVSLLLALHSPSTPVSSSPGSIQTWKSTSPKTAMLMSSRTTTPGSFWLP